MKMTLHRWTWLVCFLLLWASIAPVHAFYNPTSGRWLSRDPIEEHGGANVNGFVANNPSSLIDTDGRIVWWVPIVIATLAGETGRETINNSVHDPGHPLGPGNVWYPRLPKPGRQERPYPFIVGKTIIVKQCQIVIVYGHGSTTSPLRWVFQQGPCSAGGVATCFPGMNAPDETHGFGAAQAQSVQAGLWGISPGTALDINDSQNNDDDASARTLSLQRVLNNLLAGIPAKVKEICRKRCCKEVEVFFERMADPDAAKDRDIPWLPPKRTYKCK